MNPVMERYLPSALVFGAALYFGWPPSAPLDLGEDLVKAKSVRWRADDLLVAPLPEIQSDPFKAVLVASAEMEVEPETGKLVVATGPIGPPAEALQAGLQLDGIAVMGGMKWAVLNGRPRLAGDTIRTNDAYRHSCEIISVGDNHILVRCEETEAEIRVRPNGSARPMPTAKPVSLPTSQMAPGEPDEEIPAPPQI